MSASMQVFDGIITDRGSKYAVSGGACDSPEAGMVIVRMLEREGLHDRIVVTRRYGGKHLGADRFRHVQDAVRYYLKVCGRPG